MSEKVQRIAIGTAIYSAEWLANTCAGQAILASWRQTDPRPRCMCVRKGVPMYIGRRGQVYYLSRMPGTGFMHAEDCASVDCGARFSGGDAYESGTIIELANGVFRVNANLDALSRQPGPVNEVRADGLLDMLIEQGNLNRVTASEPKRTWASVRERLLEAARWIQIGDAPLNERLFVPERYIAGTNSSLDTACEDFIKARGKSESLLIAPLRQLRRNTYSWQIQLKHLPHLRLWMSPEIAVAVEERFGGMLFAAPPPFALCLAIVRPGRREGNYSVTNLSIRPTDANFLPCRTEHQSTVAAVLLGEGHSILRPLLFDCPPLYCLADFALVDTVDLMPVFVLSPSGDEAVDAAKRALAQLRERNAIATRIFR